MISKASSSLFAEGLLLRGVDRKARPRRSTWAATPRGPKGEFPSRAEEATRWKPTTMLSPTNSTIVKIRGSPLKVENDAAPRGRDGRSRRRGSGRSGRSVGRATRASFKKREKRPNDSRQARFGAVGRKMTKARCPGTLKTDSASLSFTHSQTAERSGLGLAPRQAVSCETN